MLKAVSTGTTSSGGGGGGGVTSLNGETGAVVIGSSGSTINVTTPTGTTINLEVAAGTGIPKANFSIIG